MLKIIQFYGGVPTQLAVYGFLASWHNTTIKAQRWDISDESRNLCRICLN